jgi:Mg/Co/Ni transporter MgtE
MKCVYKKVTIYSDITKGQSGRHTSTVGHIVRSESVGSAWASLEHVCGKLRGLYFRYLTYSDEVKALELVNDSSRRHFTSHISAQSQTISRDISDLELARDKFNSDYFVLF